MLTTAGKKEMGRGDGQYDTEFAEGQAKDLKHRKK